MILCINANAAIDKTVIVRGFRLNEIHRPERVLALPGGKGINAARGLLLLGDRPVVSGWVGGFAGEFIETGLHREGIETSFVHTDQESRTCLSILDPDNETLTEIYEKGDPVTSDQVQAFREHFKTIVGDYAAVTFSGSLPPGVPLNFYRELLEIAYLAGVPGFLDTSGEPLRLGIEGRPFLVKPNRQELASALGKDLRHLTEVADAARDIVARFGSRVVISLGGDGALAADGTEIVHVRPPPVTIQSAVGSGDCALAGVTFGLTHGFPFAEAVRYGVAAGTANALTVGAGKFTRPDFERVLALVTVQSSDQH